MHCVCVRNGFQPQAAMTRSGCAPYHAPLLPRIFLPASQRKGRRCLVRMNTKAIFTAPPAAFPEAGEERSARSPMPFPINVQSHLSHLKLLATWADGWSGAIMSSFLHYESALPEK